jgi:deoxycytidine triphosphate deaminase
MLNAKEILEEKLIVLDNAKGKPAQVGYDLSIKSIKKLTGDGQVLKNKTIVNKLDTISMTEAMDLEGVEVNGWWLEPGTYDVTCNEGCNIHANRTAMVRQRSSLLRNGAIIASSIFDPGFYTDNIGTVMVVNERIFIEKDARIAQMYFHENNEGELYDGQFQNDKQRK